MGKERLLDILVSDRMNNALNEVLSNDYEYQMASEQQDTAFREMENLRLSSAQNKVIDRAISAINHSSAVYGAVAYRQGLQDGIRLVFELKKFV